MAFIWAAYNRALTAQPLVVKACTSLVGFGLGDLLAQKLVDKKESIDWKRTARMATFGLLWHGPSGHYFYGSLDAKMPGTAMSTVFKKVAIDQSMFNPLFGIAFFSYLGLCEGKTPSQVGDKIKADLPTAVTGSWLFWIPAHTVNFRFVPASQRLLYINTLQLGYNIFLSCLGNKAVAPAPDVCAKKE
ncbi:hypothetical protein M885DRAFT_526287 [Pelagophyceae sp. CCMP2097]|nr:hypothetical protein M885DRAFT_526287 [Pelagophyceae sp. CCMP2097]